MSCGLAAALLKNNADGGICGGGRTPILEGHCLSFSPRRWLNTHLIPSKCIRLFIIYLLTLSSPCIASGRPECRSQIQIPVSLLSFVFLLLYGVYGRKLYCCFCLNAAGFVLLILPPSFFIHVSSFWNRVVLWSGCILPCYFQPLLDLNVVSLCCYKCAVIPYWLLCLICMLMTGYNHVGTYSLEFWRKAKFIQVSYKCYLVSIRHRKFITYWRWHQEDPTLWFF